MEILLKRTDKGYTFEYQLLEENGEMVNLTGATVVFKVGDKTNMIVNNNATIKAPATNGRVEYTFTETDTLVSGCFMGEFEVTFSSGKRFSYPRSGYLTVNITPNVDGSVLQVNVDLETTLGNRLYSMEKYLSEITYNVKAFGAKGDGVTDDTVKIQNALDYAATNGGGKVHLPYGIYLISSTLWIAGNIMLTGIGRKGSLIRLANGANCDIISTYEDGQQRYYLQLRDFGVDGNAQNQATGTSDGIVVSNMNEFLIDNVGIWNPRGSGLITKGTGDKMSTVPMIRNLLVRGSELYTEGDGIALNQGSYDAILTGCDVGFFKSGAGLNMAYHNGATISDCNLWQNRFGLYAAHSNRTRFSNILSDYANRFGFFFDNSHDLQVVNAQSRMSSIETDQLYDGFYFSTCYNVQLTNPKVISAAAGSPNYLDGETGFGMALHYSQNFDIVNYQSNAIKGRYYKNSCTNIRESTMTLV